MEVPILLWQTCDSVPRRTRWFKDRDKVKLPEIFQFRQIFFQHQRLFYRLGEFSLEDHRTWLENNPLKRPKKKSTSISHHYSKGSLCELTGNPRETEVGFFTSTFKNYKLLIIICFRFVSSVLRKVALRCRRLNCIWLNL